MGLYGKIKASSRDKKEGLVGRKMPAELQDTEAVRMIKGEENARARTI